MSLRFRIRDGLRWFRGLGSAVDIDAQRQAIRGYAVRSVLTRSISASWGRRICPDISSPAPVARLRSRQGRAPANPCRQLDLASSCTTCRSSGSSLRNTDSCSRNIDDGNVAVEVSARNLWIAQHALSGAHCRGMLCPMRTGAISRPTMMARGRAHRVPRVALVSQAAGLAQKTCAWWPPRTCPEYNSQDTDKLRASI